MLIAQLSDVPQGCSNQGLVDSNALREILVGLRFPTSSFLATTMIERTCEGVLRPRVSAEPWSVALLHHPPFVCGIRTWTSTAISRRRNCGRSSSDSTTSRWCSAGTCTIDAQALGEYVVCACPSTATAIDLRLLTSAEPASHVGPRACMLHVWMNGNGWSVHTSQIGHFDGLIRSRDSTTKRL